MRQEPRPSIYTGFRTPPCTNLCCSALPATLHAVAASLRITLSDEHAAALDALRGPATRTAYARWLLERDLAAAGRSAGDVPGVAAAAAAPVTPSGAGTRARRGIARILRRA